MGWLIFFAVAFFVGIIPLGVIAILDQQNVQFYLKLGPLQLPLIANKKNKEKKSPPKETKKSFESHVSVKKKKDKSSLKRYTALLQPIFRFLTDFKRKLIINDLQMKVVMGGDDPCDLSINYGKAWIALGNLMPILERVFVIKNRNLEVECDFTSAETKYSGRADVSISLFCLLQIVVYHGIVILREYLQIYKNSKDGAVS